MSSDLDNDGWTDIYVANDFDEPDNLYLNNGDGTFRNVIHDAVGHMSNFGMGVDAADYNNDGLLDLVVLDMVAEDNYRQKTQMASMNPRKFWTGVESGFHYQYMRNTLQLNNGTANEDNFTFSEVGQLAGISNTDWSWAGLFADLNNNGRKDLFITNGYRRDSRDKDYLKNIEKKKKQLQYKQMASGGKKSKSGTMGMQEYLGMMTATPLKNYYFENNGDLTFTKQTDEYGFTQASFSNGAAYADFDNDGDLDLVVNNILDRAYVYKNFTRERDNANYLRINLEG